VTDRDRLQAEVGLEETHLDGVDRLELVARPIQMMAALNLASCADEMVELGDFRLGESIGQTQLAQVALGTSSLQRGQIDWDNVLRRHLSLGRLIWVNVDPLGIGIVSSC